MMLQGHTLHTVLASQAATGLGFRVWEFTRGLTACMFLLLSGFAFAFATRRHWTDHLTSPARITRRLRRFGFFLLLGYALHFPAARLALLSGMSDERWRSFLAVDVLQCVAVMLTALQLLVLAARIPRRHAFVTAGGSVVLVILTPAMWRFDWTGPLPLAAAAYLSPATGSLFPLFPWGAYVLLGAALGHLHVRWGSAPLASFANAVLLAGGAAFLSVSFVCAKAPWQPFGPTDFWFTSPNLFLLRAGLVLLVLGALAHLSRRVSTPPSLVRALAAESLTIYAVHLCIVYGSVWNPGLRDLIGPTLPVLPALGCVLAVWGSMALLAWAWHWCKHRHPGAAQWVRVGTGGLLLGMLL